MNDNTLESRLRFAMERHAGEMAVPASAPIRLLRRTRRRQAAVALVSGVAVIVLALGAFAALRDLGHAPTAPASSPATPGPSAAVTSGPPGTAIARGTTDGRSWTVSVEGSGSNLTVSAEASGESVGVGLAVGPSDHAARLWATVMRLEAGPAGPRLVFGLASPDVSSVRIEPTGETAKLLPVPRVAGFQVFVVGVGSLGPRAAAVAEDERGTVLAREPLGPGPGVPSPVRSP